MEAGLGAKADFWYALGIEDDTTARSDAVRQSFPVMVYRKLTEKTGMSQTEFHDVTLIPISSIKRILICINNLHPKQLSDSFRQVFINRIFIPLADGQYVNDDLIVDHFVGQPITCGA